MQIRNWRGTTVILRHERLPDERFSPAAKMSGSPLMVVHSVGRLEKRDEQLNPL